MIYCEYLIIHCDYFYGYYELINKSGINNCIDL